MNGKNLQNDRDSLKIFGERPYGERSRMTIGLLLHFLMRCDPSDLHLMEGLELVRRHRDLVVVQMRERVLGAVMMGIIVGVDGLRLEARDGIELLDGRSPQTRQRAEDRALDLGNFGVLDGINE